MNLETAKLIAPLPFGFLTSAEMPRLVALAPHQPCLVRCGYTPRFLCAARDVAARIAAVEASGDYVRDVCIPSTEYRAACLLAAS